MKSSIKIFILTFFITSCLTIDCPPGFDLMPPKSPFGVCVVIGCMQPFQDQTCKTQCIEGYTKTITGLCQVIKCSSSSKTACTVCSFGYQLQASLINSVVRVCTPMNCQDYDKTLRTCNKCQAGYKLNNDGTCSILHCVQSSSGQSQCLKCAQGYTLSKYVNGVDICLPDNCATFSNTTFECLKCQSNAVQTQEGYCKLGYDFCKKFNQFSGLCYQCETGYRLVAFKLCVKQNPLCVSYGDQGCTQCKVKYRANKGICQANFCDAVDEKDPTKCVKCEPGYIVNTQGLCVVQNCINFDEKTWRCSQCKNLFTLNSVPSVSNPLFIVQRCLSSFCQLFDSLQYKCRKCGDQYTLENGTCIFSNCEVAGPNNCEVCVDGWMKNHFGNCVNYDCFQYITSTKCSSCNQGRRLLKDMCITDYCILRSNKDNSCAQCPTGLDLVNNQFCLFPFCKKSNPATGECLECFATYKINRKGNCQSTVCLKYEQNTNQNVGANCLQCAQGYIPNGVACIPDTKYCTDYNFTEGTCLQCSDGYELNSNKTICIPQKCLSSVLVSTYSTCRKCVVGYRLLDLGNNVQKCVLNNCSTSSGNSCKKCVDKFMLIFDVCLAENCKTFNQAGFCTACNLGFYLNQTTYTCIRERCLQDSGPLCVQCEPSFYADKANKGLCRPYNCENVQYKQRITLPNKVSLGSIKCLKCAQGFLTMPNMDMCLAQDCNDINPLTGACRDCRSGFNLQDNGSCQLAKNNGFCQQGKYPNVNYMCQPMKAKNCISANPFNTSQCYKCQDNYFLKDFVCRNYSNCLSRNDYLGCLQCELGYQVNTKTGQCEGKIPNCKKYDRSTGQCQECLPSYQITVYPFKACKIVPAWCAVLDMWGNCQSCNLPQRVLNADKKCILQTAKCTQYNEANGFCSKCEDKYYLSDEEPPACRPNPRYCLQFSSNKCTKCESTTILSDGACYEQISNCISYQRSMCTRCLPLFYVSLSQQQCKPFPKYCDKVVLNTDGICDQCRAGFTNADGVCVRNIQFCTYYTSDGKCSRCQDGYTVSSTRSICLLG